jgi:hypothetical protein
LDYEGYPVIAPYNQTFPSYYTLGRLSKNSLKYSSYTGGKYELFINVSSPLPGHWFTSSFIDFINVDKIQPSDVSEKKSVDWSAFMETTTKKKSKHDQDREYHKTESFLSNWISVVRLTVLLQNNKSIAFD